jgi:hypothetical protein
MTVIVVFENLMPPLRLFQFFTNFVPEFTTNVSSDTNKQCDCLIPTSILEPSKLETNLVSIMNGNGHSVMSPMEMEPVLGKKATNADEEDQPHSNPLQTLHNLWLLIVAYAEYYQGTILAVISILIMTSVIILLEKIAYASTTKTHRPNIRKDYSNASSMIDLQFGKIDHWCLQVSPVISIQDV